MGIQDSEKRWRTFSLVVDSGAVVSLLCRSVAELLRIPIEAGQRITVTGIGRKPNEVFIHQLVARIGDEPAPELPTRFAISPSEDVPNLLGRLDVFDRFQVDFDPSLHETAVLAPWLNADNRRIWLHLIETEATIVSRWAEHPLPGRVDRVARLFVDRAGELSAAVAGLAKLHRHHALDPLLRSLFELLLQFEYMMLDPEPRAAMYDEFEPGASGHWHRKKSLKVIAETVGRAKEYDLIYGPSSAWLHHAPWAMGKLEVGLGAVWQALGYWAKLLIQVADAKKIVLSGNASESLVTLGRPWD